MGKGVIIYIGGFELPDKNAAAHRVLSNAKLFRDNGKKVVFIGIDKTLPLKNDILETYAKVEGFDSYAIPYPKRKRDWLKYLTYINDYIKIYEEYDNVEMFILYNFQSIAMKKIMTFCKKKSIKCCADVTEWRSAKGENIVYRLLKDLDTWYRMKILHKKFDGLIVISRYLKKYYENYVNICYLPPLVDLSDNKWINNYEKSLSRLNIVYAGSPQRKDRVDIVVNAIHLVKRDYHLDIIGITSDEFLKLYPEYKNIIDDNIEFHGRVPHLQAIEYVKKANYSCFFRKYDRVSKAGFPTKFVESITCGTPIISNNTSDINEYIVDSKNGVILNNLDVNSIVEKIEEVPILMDVNRKSFDYQKFSNEFNKFINKVLENK